MKKHLYTLLFMAVALFSAVSLASCSSDNNDNPGGGGDKPVAEKINVYAGYISSDVFDLCDISLTLHSGTKSKTVKLDKASGKLMDVVYASDLTQDYTYPAYRFLFDNVDGNKGIDKVEAKAVLKSGVPAMIEAMSPEASIVCLVASAFVKAEFQPTGNYSFAANVQTVIAKFGREGLLREKDGKKGYETLPAGFELDLSK